MAEVAGGSVDGDPLIGTRVGGYLIEGLLGQGGMGKVYRARQLSLSRAVAVKFLSGGMASRPEVIARFAREARAAAAVSNPHLIQVHDFVETGDTPFYVMELVEGLSLGDYLKRGESFLESECIEIGRQALKALGAAHAAGIVHRDIKPGNLMLDPKGQIKVGDLGLARVADSGDETTLTVTGAMMGTPLYMSPEQGRGQASVDYRSDFYSLGATLFHLSTRRPPYAGNNPLEIIQRHIADPVPWARDANPAVSGTFADLIRSLMAKDPKDRPQTHAEIFEQLDACAALLDSTDLATGPTVMGRVRVRSKEAARPFYARPGVLVGALAVLLAAGGVFGLMRWREDRQQEIQRRQESAVVAERVRAEAEQRRLGAEAEAAKLRAAEQENQRRAALEAERQQMEQERLAKARGGLLVRTEPAGAMVSVDGSEGKPGPVAAFSDLGVGRHRVAVTLEGHAPVELEVDVGEGKVTEIGPVAMEPLIGSSQMPGPEAMPIPSAQHLKPAIRCRPSEEALAVTASSTLGARAEQGRGFTNGVGMVMVWMKPGSFTMGSDTGEAGAKPAHQVMLNKGFWLGECEVTQEQWRHLMDPNPSKFQGDEDLPVESVSWEDATAFCAKLTELERAEGKLSEGWEYGLPTEAQWEYACRAGMEGDHAVDVDAIAWHKGNSWMKTHPVKVKKPNAWGFHDMHGNVWEWCVDWYGPYTDASVTDPVGPSTGSSHVRRGGSWFSDASSCQSSIRGRNYAGGHILGFRVALIPPAHGGQAAGIRVAPAARPKAETGERILNSTSKHSPFVNSLGMRFVPVHDWKVLFCIWETRVRDFEAFVKDSGYDWNEKPPFEQGPDHPVVMVSWDDANAFCAWLSKREGKQYRLPTDEEWEAVVGQEKYPWGRLLPPPKGAENIAGEESLVGDPWDLKAVPKGYKDGHPRTAPVGSYKANNTGLYDVGGNVREWVEDWYTEALCEKHKEGGGFELKPEQLADIKKGNVRRVVRGGCWGNCSSGSLVSSYRYPNLPDARNFLLGFRCVVVAPAP